MDLKVRRELISYLSFFIFYLVYSTAVSPAVLAGINETIKIVEKEFEIRSEKIYRYSNAIKSALRQNGFSVADSEAPISSVIGGNSFETISFAKKLFYHEILSTPFVYPSVPKNDGRIRLIAGANLKESSIEKVIDIFSMVRPN